MLNLSFDADVIARKIKEMMESGVTITTKTFGHRVYGPSASESHAFEGYITDHSRAFGPQLDGHSAPGNFRLRWWRKITAFDVNGLFTEL